MLKQLITIAVDRVDVSCSLEDILWWYCSLKLQKYTNDAKKTSEFGKGDAEVFYLLKLKFSTVLTYRMYVITFVISSKKEDWGSFPENGQ